MYLNLFRDMEDILTYRLARIAKENSSYFIAEPDVKRTDTGVSVELHVPGIPRDKIDITFSDDTMIIEGRHENKHFKRTYEVRGNLDKNSTKAKLDLGVLTITIDEKERETKKITVD